MLSLPPLSLYVHIPWCVRKCPYCDFNSHQADAGLPESDYIAALERDLQEELPFVQGRAIGSIFFGGGTPSLFSAEGIQAILAVINRHLSVKPNAEITLEVNPGTAEQAKFAGFFQSGVNRLSIGVQSFHAEQLAHLGRIHSAEEAQRAIASAIDCGYQHINIDLMHGLPQQSTQQALADVQTAIDFGVDHISWYQLTIEPNTHFYSSPPTLPCEDVLADIQDAGTALLAEHGYGQYEVSAFAKTGGRSRHNLNYWRFGDYLGIGAGAHGKLTQVASGKILRRWKTRQPEHYLRPKSPLAGANEVPKAQLLLEFSMNALRLVAGVEKNQFSQTTGLPWPEATLQPLVDQGFLQDSDTQFVTTELGMRFLNHVLAEIDRLAKQY